MLLELVVENYAVVERLRVHFHAGLNLMTGETGSGKSIVVDALGLLLGRVAIAPVLIKIRPLNVVLGAAVLMAITTYSVLQVSDPKMAAIAVFCAGLAMAPVFPTTLAVLANIFQQGTATAIGFTITCGFTGLTVSSPIIGWLSGTDPNGLGTGLMVLPIFSIVIVGITLLLLRSKAVPDGSAIGSRATAPIS